MLDTMRTLVGKMSRAMRGVSEQADAGLFTYGEFRIPVELIKMTGGGPETWDEISKSHMGQYARYCPIAPTHRVLEIGCGVGRDAIQLTKILSAAGAYTGIDIIKPSIVWCQKNITPRYPNFRFEHFDIQSQIHNSHGKLKTTDVRLPALDGSVDRILLQSVFTHMFEADIIHYLKELRRILKPDGVAFASFFVVDDETRQMALTAPAGLTFPHLYGDGCYINTHERPEGAVAYTRAAIDRMLTAGDVQLKMPIHLGFWSGRTGVPDSQDILILARS